MASRFEREMPHCNIGTIGSVEEGETALGIAIANTLNSLLGTGECYSVDNNDNIVENVDGKINLNAVCVDYETENRKYTHVDCLNSMDCIKNMICARYQMDGAILVVDAVAGITSQIKEHLAIANKTGIFHVLVFVDKCDLVDEERLEQLDDEIRELLEESGYPGYDTLIMQGSIQGAVEEPTSEWGEILLEFIEMVDEYMPNPERATDKPFVMAVEDVFSVTGRGTVATGRIESGVIRLNDRLEVVGFDDENLSVVVTGIEMFRKLLDEAEAGDNVGLLLRGVQRTEIKYGHVLMKPGRNKSHSKFTALVYFLTEGEGGACSTFSDGYNAQFHLRTANVSGVVSFLEKEEYKAGEYAEVTVELAEPLAMEESLTFWICDVYKHEVGLGKIVEIL